MSRSGTRLKKWALPFSCLIAFTCSGCYSTRAVISPYSYAPRSSADFWKPPSSVKAMSLSDEPPELPEQEAPYSLAELIDIGLRNNVQTKITWAQARSAAAQYGESQQQLFPQFAGNFSYERVRTPSFQTGSTGPSSSAAASATAAGGLSATTVKDIYYTDFGPNLTVTYLVFDFGTLRATTEASRQALYNADWTHNDAIQTVLQTVMNDFYAYLYQKQLLVANIANIETATLTLQATEVGLETGVRDVSDYLQAKTELLQNQTTWAAQQQNVENAMTALLTNMGLPANLKISTQELPTTLPQNDFLPPLEELITVALQNRPDLLAGEANLRSMEQSLRAAKTQYLPKIKYDFDIGKVYFNKGLHDKYNFDSVFSVSMPLFAGFYYRNAIKEAQANKKLAEEELKNTQLTVIQQVTNYHYNVGVAFETVQFANAFLAAAQEQFTVALSKYKEGTNTILDVVSAQSSLADARARLANGIQQWYTSLANLSYSTGLISPTDLPTSTQEVIQLVENNMEATHE